MKMTKMEKRQKTANVGEEEQQVGVSSMAGGSVNSSLWKNYLQYLLKLHVHLLYDPAILLLGMHPRETCTYFHQRKYKKVHSKTISNSQYQ